MAPQPPAPVPASVKPATRGSFPSSEWTTALSVPVPLPWMILISVMPRRRHSPIYSGHQVLDLLRAERVEVEDAVDRDLDGIVVHGSPRGTILAQVRAVRKRKRRGLTSARTGGSFPPLARQSLRRSSDDENVPRAGRPAPSARPRFRSSGGVPLFPFRRGLPALRRSGGGRSEAAPGRDRAQGADPPRPCARRQLLLAQRAREPQGPRIPQGRERVHRGR